MKKASVTLALLCLLAIGWLGVHFSSGWEGAAAVPDVTPPPSPSIPVMADLARGPDVPGRVPGLGTVQAFNSARPKSRVEGQILKIQLREGQVPPAGDISAALDPRSASATLAR